MIEFDLGTASVFPQKPFVTGSFATITYKYTAGHPIDYAGYIKLTFRNMDDFGTPQFDNPAAPNYCTVHTTGNSRIIPRWDRKGAKRPSNKAIYLLIRDEFVDRGDVITIIFGDTSGGSPGWQLPTYTTDHFEFTTFVDPIATYQFKQLPDSPGVPLIAGEPTRAVCTAPSEVLAGEEFDAHLLLQDRWGNPTSDPLAVPQAAFKKTGTFTLAVRDDKTNLEATSNPIDVFEKEPVLKKYWADFHGQSGETIGSNTIEEYFAYGRDASRLDILGHQGNDFQVTDEFWEKINDTTKAYYEPGKFVTFPGYEWSGNTPVGGDRNVFFTAEGGEISRSSLEQVPERISKYAYSLTAESLFENLKAQKGPRPFVFAHVGGRYADLRMHDPEIELAIEVHSVWGTFEWFLFDALQRGFRVGIVANSDGHKCDPGSAYPGNSKFSTPGGLTCVLAEKLDRESVYAAIKARHMYATSNPRVLMDLSLEIGGTKAMMGDIVEIEDGKEATLSVRLAGSGPIQRVDIFNRTDLIATERPYSEENLGRRVRIVWNGARVRGQDRVLRWDGGLTVSGNTIEAAAAINFWNPDHPLRIQSAQELKWESFTTGTVKGVLMTLAEPMAGSVHFDTVERKLDFNMKKLGLAPKIWEMGELEKYIRVERLPDEENPTEFSFRVPINNLKTGDNPIFIRMTQENGQKAWSSPVYLIK